MIVLCVILVKSPLVAYSCWIMGKSVFWCLKPACLRAKHKKEVNEDEQALEEHEEIRVRASTLGMWLRR